MGQPFEGVGKARQARLVREAEEAKLKEEHMRKNLHSVIFRHTGTEDLSPELTFAFLKSAGLRSETEGFLMAVRDGVWGTLVYRRAILKQGIASTDCRARPSVIYLLSACPSYAPPSTCKGTTPLSESYISISGTNTDAVPELPYSSPDIQSVVGNDGCSIHWNCLLPTTRPLLATKPDIVQKERYKNQIFVVEFSCPAEANIASKDKEKRDKYRDLVVDVRQRYPGHEEMITPVVLVHGGAGNIADSAVEAKVEGVRRAVEMGYKVLSRGGSSLDAAQACVEVMEEDPAFNAGKGSVLNSDGEIEMDAIIMEGTNLNLGSVGGVRNILHPVALARRVMEESRAAMLVGEGANRFAREQGFPTTPSYKLATSAAVVALDMYLNNPDGAACEFECGGVGTVGAVVVDKNGRVACATSTGGTTGKPPGRLGDTPIPGCGGYADDSLGAVSTTGRGESIMRVCLSQRILNIMKEGKSAQEATEEALRFMGSTVGDTAGAITVSSAGDLGIAFISKRMAWGYKKGEGPVFAGVDKAFQ